MTAAACRACDGPLDASLVDNDGAGLHPSCIAAPEAKLPIVHGVLARYQAGLARSRQSTLGPSQIGDPCDRALAYALAGTPKARDEPLKWLALVGTWAHEGVTEAFVLENKRLGRERYLLEQRVELPSALVPGGTTDLYDTDCEEVVDWKLVGVTPLRKYRKHGPSAAYRTQAHVYGLGWARLGHPVASVRIVFLPRSGLDVRDGWEWSEPWSERVAVDALARVERIKGLSDALDVAGHPERFALVRADDDGDCEYCPWLRPWEAPDSNAPASGTGCPGLGSK